MNRDIPPPFPPFVSSAWTLTTKMLIDMPPGCIFASGLVPNADTEDGIFMNRAGGMLKWLAKRGEGYHDWAIYMLFSDSSFDEIERVGDKCPLSCVEKLVKCDKEAMYLYRI